MALIRRGSRENCRAAGRRQFVPYYSRREIDEVGSLRGRGLEIAWVKDPMELFFSAHSRLRDYAFG